MSVINQVLNQLEQRGAHTIAEQPMVRAVQHSRRNVAMPMLATGLALLAGIAAWQWMSPRKPDVMAASVAAKEGNASGVAKLAVQKQAAAPDAAPASGIPAPGAPVSGAPLSDVPAGNLPVATFKPASRLSLELSSVPAPPGKDSGQDSRSEKYKLVASLAPATKAGEDAPVRPARQRSKPAASENAITAAQPSAGAVPMKQVSSAQLADAEFRRAAGLMQLGRIDEAMAGYRTALHLDAGHEAARQALVALLLEGKRNADAESVLLEGLNTKPEHTGLTMLLARLQVERGALPQATATLETSLKFAETQADYRAFLAALLQRQSRNEEAIKHYQIVLQQAPSNGVWQMGYGISLLALQRNAEAKEAFQRALDTKALSPELQAFVQAKLKGL